MFTEVPYQLSDLDQGLTGRLRYLRRALVVQLIFADESRSRGDISAVTGLIPLD